jgi:hypothetical protein
MSDTFELPKGLEDFPKTCYIVLDTRNKNTPVISNPGDKDWCGGQEYHHWSILNNYVHKNKYEKVTSEAIVRLSQLLTKVNEGVSNVDLQNDIKECLINLCKEA